MITGACRIRKILTTRSPLLETTGIWLSREYGDEVSQEYEERFNYENGGGADGMNIMMGR
jgi:hypothetical protein